MFLLQSNKHKILKFTAATAYNKVMVKLNHGISKNFIINVQFVVLVLVTTQVSLLACDAIWCDRFI